MAKVRKYSDGNLHERSATPNGGAPRSTNPSRDAEQEPGRLTNTTAPDNSTDRQIKDALISGRAFKEARERALAAGHEVLVVRDGFIYRISRDGSSEMVLEIAKRRSVERGTQFSLGD